MKSRDVRVVTLQLDVTCSSITFSIRVYSLLGSCSVP